MSDDERGPAPLDHTDGAEATGVLVLAAQHVRRPNQLGRRGMFRAPVSVPVLPLLAVDGRAVRLGAGNRVHVRLAAGPHLVEIMDDHHYESRTVHVGAGATARLWFGVGLLRSEPRIYLGSQEYAAGSMRVDRRAEQVAALCSVTAFVAGLMTLLPWLTDAPGVPEHIPILSVIAAAVVVFWPSRALARRSFARRGPVDIGAPAPETVAATADTGHDVMLLPRGALLPDADAAVCLHFRADPRALASIRIWDRINVDFGPKRLMPYFSNSRVDWLDAPEVSVNGRPLPPRWGTWWIPVRPGQVRLRVRLPGFVNGQFRGPGGTAELDVPATPGRVHHVECRYNIVELADARLRERPDAESEWQRELGARGQLAWAKRWARAPRVALRPRRTAPITPDARLAR